MAQYQGEHLPPHIIRILTLAKPIFTYVAVLTPYHDVAGKDWQDIAWIRAIDPYLVGFQKGLPVMFILGRFSDSGIFPGFHQLVADTVNFLRVNKEKLAGFNAVSSPFWFTWQRKDRDQQRDSCFNGPLGDHLIAHTNQLLQAFELGHLFDWLRGEWDIPTQELPTSDETEQLADGNQPSGTSALSVPGTGDDSTN